MTQTDCISRFIHRISRIFFYAACLCCFCLVLITFEQVVARYCFDEPSIALQELEWHLFGAVFLLALADTFRRNGHVRVDLIYGRLPPRGRSAIDTLGILFMLLPTCGMLIYYGYEDILATRSYVSPVTMDHWCSLYLDPTSAYYPACLSVENWVRSTILVGESSSNPDGLGARWIIKAVLPLSFVVVSLEGIASLVQNIRTLIRGQ